MVHKAKEQVIDGYENFDSFVQRRIKLARKLLLRYNAGDRYLSEIQQLFRERGRLSEKKDTLRRMISRYINEFQKKEIKARRSFLKFEWELVQREKASERMQNEAKIHRRTVLKKNKLTVLQI